MTVTDRTSSAGERDRPAGGAGLDWAMAVLSTGFVGGLFLDGWAHTHGTVRGDPPDDHQAGRLAAVRLCRSGRLLPLLFPGSAPDGRHRLVGPPLGRIHRARRDHRLAAQLSRPPAPIVGGHSL